MPFAKIVLKSWNEIHGHAKHGWMFRGQRSSDWSLQTSLERCCDRHGVQSDQRPHIEQELFREFRRTYHQYARHLPKAHSLLEWMAVMQHHGAPTRLLDFTYSIYIAAYFALESADGDCAVWAFNGPWALQQSLARLEAMGKPNLGKLHEPFQEDHEELLAPVFFEPPYVRVACPLNPFRLNERLRIQKGAFLVPGEITASFVDNLQELPGHDSAEHVVQLVIPRALSNEALKQLFQMNVSRTSLFPGLDGFAQALGVYHPVFDPIKWV